MGDRAEDLGYLLNHVTRLLRSDLSARLKPFGLTPAQFAVLADLGRAGSARPSEVAERIGLDRPTMSGVVARLCRDGWLETSEHPEDRRSQLVRLTPRAAEVLPDLTAAARASAGEVLRPLAPAEQEALAVLLARVAPASVTDGSER